MKKIILLAFVSIVVVMLNSCAPMYKTQSSGKDNVSYVIVLKESVWVRYNNVAVVVDDTIYPYGYVYRVRAKNKAHPVMVEPGRHNVKVIVNGAILVDEEMFLGLQETKSIVLR